MSTIQPAYALNETLVPNITEITPTSGYINYTQNTISIKGEGLYRPGFYSPPKVYLDDEEATYLGSLGDPDNGDPADVGYFYQLKEESTLGSRNVIVENIDGERQTIVNGYTLLPLPDKKIHSVAFTVDNNDKRMTVNGEGLVGLLNPAEYANATARSLVTLNDIALPFCTHNVGTSAEEFIEGGVPLGLVSDSAPCYFIISQDGEVLINTEKAIILLPDDFDVTAQGTVSVNGSDTFAFNQKTTPPDDGSGEAQPVDPTILLNNKPLEGKPTVSKRPTFSGAAEPGATITVTVRSDPVTCTTTADSNGNWSCTLPSDLPAGDHTVTVTVANPDGSTDTLGPYAVVVPGNGTGATVTSGDAVLAPDTGVFKMVTMQGGSLVFAAISAMTICIAALAGFVGIRRFMYRRNS